MCTVAPQGRAWQWVRRITGANRKCSSLMKDPDEEADWSPLTDQLLPFPFSWVLRCITGGESQLTTDPYTMNLRWYRQTVCVLVHCVYVCFFLSYSMPAKTDLFQIQWRVL